MLLIVIRSGLIEPDAVGTRHRCRLAALEGGRNGSAEALGAAIVEYSTCRPGRISILKDIHTESGVQGTRWARTSGCDLIPYTAAGWQRRVSGRMRTRRRGPWGCRITDPASLST